MRIAITGATGYLGRHILASMPPAVEPLLLTRNTHRVDNEFIPESAVIKESDYSHDSFLKALVGCDGVIHLAAKRRVENFNAVNLQIDQNLFYACQKLGISNIVFSSSRSVYGSKNAPWTEKSVVSPNSPYALGKLQSELAAEFFNNCGLRIKCLRIARVLGVGESFPNVISHFISSAKSGMQLSVSSLGDRGREYIYVKDVSSAIWSAINNEQGYGVFNVGSGRSISLLELAKKVDGILGGAGVNIDPNAKKLDEYCVMNSQKFCNTFGWTPNWTIEEALKDIHDEIAE